VTTQEPHIPVLAQEILYWLQPQAGGCYLDGTLGLGGHTELILHQSGPSGQVLGFEWDSQAADYAQTRLASFGKRFHLIPHSYADLAAQCHQRGYAQMHGLLADLGVSSLQLDCAERGFSFMEDGPLDMRMNTKQKISAADLVNTLSQDELADILYNYGEERQARRIARWLVEARLEQPISSTRQLAQLVQQAVPAAYWPKKIHPATKVFQALRIAVNRELDNVNRLLHDGPHLLLPGARLCVISFHSLEDRMVKQAFSNNPSLRVLTKKPILASLAEMRANPRSRSAKLRVAEKM
jgi:16S rRNA (cytosine1402-N4)-methyltransferase